MAILVPDTILPDQYAPEAERRLLAQLGRENTISHNWVVLHSLKINKHVTRMTGEADFVVMVPGRGFLVVEVKGCGVERKGGKWIYFYDPPRESNVGPFQQAEDAMRSIWNWLERRRFPQVGKILWQRCVVFPEFDFREESTEWSGYEIINRSDIDTHGVVTCLQRVLDRRHAIILREIDQKPDSYGWYRSHEGRPDQSLVENIAETLRGDFSYRADSDSELRRSIAALAAAVSDATEEQARWIINATRNRQVLLTGAAGTGKTFAAQKLAKMWTGQGLKVGFFCYNNLLAEHLRRVLAGSNAPCFVGTLDSFRLTILGERVPEDLSADYWSKMRERALDVACQGGNAYLFDVLVVDEAQDLTDELSLDLLDLVLEGGLKEGRWAFFGDFARQAIYSTGVAGEELVDRIASRSSGCFELPLTINCRNAHRVATNISILGGLEPDYDDVRNRVISGRVKAHFCGSEEEKQNKLIHLVGNLFDRYGGENVVILSPYREGLAFRARKNGRSGLAQPMRLLNPGEHLVRFGTIHAFKGLEAKAVILTDCDWKNDERVALLYVGLSRAEVEAHLILDESQRKAYQERVMP